PLPRSTLFPYTTLFRSSLLGDGARDDDAHVGGQRRWWRGRAVAGARRPVRAARRVRRAGLESLEACRRRAAAQHVDLRPLGAPRSEEHTSELQSPCNLV